MSCDRRKTEKETKRKPVTRREGTQYPNIVPAARRLGVHRITLWRAVTGRSKNTQLAAQYQSLVGLKAVAA